MTAPFFACSPSVWPRYVAGVLAVSTDPWESDDVVSDLRWHVDQRKKLPGRSKLMARWRWPDWAVRKMLVNTALWWDPTKGEAPTSRDDLGKSRLRVPSQRHQDPSRRLQDPSCDQPEDHETTPSMDENPPGALLPPPDALLPPPHDLLTVSTRATTSPAPITDHLPPPPANMNGASGPSASDGPCQVCGHIIAAGCQHGITGPLGADPGLSVTSGLLFHHRPLEAVRPPPATTDIAPAPRKASKAPGAPAKGIADPAVAQVWEVYRSHRPGVGATPAESWKVPAAVQRHGVAIMIRIIEWAFTSEDQRPRTLRADGNVGPTLFRPSHDAEYALLSAEWQARGRLATPAAPGRQLSAREQTNSDIDRWLEENRQKARRDVIEAQEERKWIG